MGIRLLVVYPSCNLDVNPTLAYLLETLSERGVAVDVLLEESGDFAVPAAHGPGVRLIPLPRGYLSPGGTSLRELPRRALRALARPGRYPGLLRDLAFFPYLHAGRYDALVGVDPAGVVVAHGFNRLARRPLVYLSFEVLCGADQASPEEREMERRERAACAAAAEILIQDEERAALFCRETGCPPERLSMVPVAPPPQEVPRSDFLRRTLGIPPERRVVLYFGSFGPWTSRDDLAEMVADWPERYCLVIHSSARLCGRVSPALRRLGAEGRVYFSGEPVSRKALPALVASADFGLAPYKAVADAWDTGENVHHLGLSSGKVAYYALCGLPILARALPVFEREFAAYDCGRVYRRLAETGPLLAELDARYAHHARESRRFYAERLNPVPGMQAFCDRLLALARQAPRRAALRRATPAAAPSR